MAESSLPELIVSLKQDVPQADKALRAENHQAVHDFFSLWFRNDGFITQVIIELELAEYNFYNDFMWAAVGLLGLARCYHVDANVQYKNKLITAAELKNKVDEIETVYEKISLSKVAPWSIEGNGIFWLGEIAQDRFRTYELLGADQEAQATASESIILIRALIHSLAMNPRILATEDTALAEDIRINKKRYIGAVSSLGVIYGRRGRLTRNLADLTRGLRYVRETSQYEYNENRLITVAGWTAAGLRYQNGIKDTVLGIKELVQAGLTVGQKRIRS